MSRRERSQVPKGAARPRQLAAPLRLVIGRRAMERGHGDRDADDHGWTTLGTFVIEFQQRQIGGLTQHRTLAHHMESAEDSRWQELVTDALLSWMLGRLVRDTDPER